jgi:hypothetical protein
VCVRGVCVCVCRYYLSRGGRLHLLKVRRGFLLHGNLSLLLLRVWYLHIMDAVCVCVVLNRLGITTNCLVLGTWLRQYGDRGA